MAVRTRVTVAAAAASRPATPSAPSTDVPTHRASALNASLNPPVDPVPMSSPRVPAAAIAIDRPLSSAPALSGVSCSVPVPQPVTPQTDIRSLTR